MNPTLRLDAVKIGVFWRSSPNSPHAQDYVLRGLAYVVKIQWLTLPPLQLSV